MICLFPVISAKRWWSVRSCFSFYRTVQKGMQHPPSHLFIGSKMLTNGDLWSRFIETQSCLYLEQNDNRKESYIVYTTTSQWWRWHNPTNGPPDSRGEGSFSAAPTNTAQQLIRRVCLWSLQWDFRPPLCDALCMNSAVSFVTICLWNNGNTIILEVFLQSHF